MVVIGEMIFIWEGNKLAVDKVCTSVSPLIGSEAPCCGGGLSIYPWWY